MDSSALYILVFLVAAISLVAIALGVSYFLLFQKYKTYKEGSLRRHKEEADAFSNRLEEAKRQSIIILTQAQEASKAIITKAHEIQNANAADLSNLVSASLAKQQASYDQSLSQISANVQKVFAGLPQSIQVQTSTELKKLVADMQAEMKVVQDSVKAILEEPYKKAQQEAEEYKLMRMKAFEDSLFELLNKVSKEVLRKELTVEDHEKLVVKALKDAKEQHIL